MKLDMFHDPSDVDTSFRKIDTKREMAKPYADLILEKARCTYGKKNYQKALKTSFSV